MKPIVAIVVVSLLIGAASCAPSSPEPSLTSAENNVAYAISAMCSPFVMDKTDEAALPTHQRLVHSDGWNEPMFQQLGAAPVRVGFAGFVHVGVAAQGGVRTCEITARRTSPTALRRAVLQALDARPEGFTPTKSRYLPGRFATEDMLCTKAGSAHPDTFVLLSSPHPEQSPMALLFTMTDGPVRGEACDHEGVPMNFRTLANP